MPLPAVNRGALDENLALGSNTYLPAIGLAAHALSAHRGTLDVDAESDADIPALRPQAGLFGAKLLVVRRGQQGIQRKAVCARIIDRLGRGFVVGKSRAGNQIAPAHFSGVQGEFMGNRIHRALDAVAGFWPPGSPIRASRDGIGLDRVNNGSDRRDRIRAGDHRGG